MPLSEERLPFDAGLELDYAWAALNWSWLSGGVRHMSDGYSRRWLGA